MQNSYKTFHWSSGTLEKLLFLLCSFRLHECLQPTHFSGVIRSGSGKSKKLYTELKRFLTELLLERTVLCDKWLIYQTVRVDFNSVS